MSAEPDDYAGDVEPHLALVDERPAFPDDETADGALWPSLIEAAPDVDRDPRSDDERARDGEVVGSFAAIILQDERERQARRLELVRRGIDPDEHKPETWPALLREGVPLLGEFEGAWGRLNLADFRGLPPEQPEIGGIFYPARRHLVSGPGESHKTWLCLAALVSEIKAGRGGIWADIDGMGPREIASRLEAFGVTEAEMRELVYFTNPTAELDDAEVARLLAWAQASKCRLLVSDAFTGFLERHGLDGMLGRDVEKAWTRLDPIKAEGIAVVLIDHVVKNADARNGQAIGSERKGTASHLHFDLTPLEKFQRDGIGRSRIGVSRDRGAFFPRPYAGELVLRSEGGRVSWQIKPPAAEGTFRPTVLMERISKVCEVYPEGITKSAVEQAVPGKTDAKRLALDILVNEGYVHREPGTKGGLIHTSLKPYREADDDAA